MQDLLIPKHIAIIMDGNGRWAKLKFMPKKLGHHQGMLAAEKIIESCQKIGVKYLTLYAFSIENWNRTEEEVNDLMKLLREYLNKRVETLLQNNVRLVFIGNRELLPDDIQTKMAEIEESSAHNDFTLILAISYGARDEIRRAANAMAQYALQNNMKDISINFLDSFINPLAIPDPDLLIRTSGEQRLSNFLLWQMAYTELYFSHKLWPDFNKTDLMEAIHDFTRRERRYGK